MKAGKKTVRTAKKTVADKRRKNAETRPGKNGGRLNAGPGPGRPKDTPEAKAEKELIKTAKGSCSAILQELIESGELRTFIVQAIEKQTLHGRIDALRWLCEYTEPPEAPGTAKDPSELLESLLHELEKAG